jgi:hypothetical protein
MSEVGKKLVDATDKIPPQDKQAFINGLNAISDKFGICRDWLYIIMMTETGTHNKIDPSASNSRCAGLIQFCWGSGSNVGGANTVGVHPSVIKNMSAVKQLKLIDQYLTAIKPVRGGDLPTTYLSILFPALRNSPRNQQLAIPKQSNHLYQGSKFTKETLENGLLFKAGLKGPAKCGEAVASTPIGYATSDPIALPGQIGTPGGQLSDFMVGECQPWDYTVASAKVYTGCEVFGVNTGASGAETNTSPTGGGVPTGGQTKAGGAIAVPPPGEGTWMNPSPGLVLTSGFGLRNVRGGSRNHQGIDLSGPMKAPIVASKSGVISAVNTGCPPAGGFPGNPCGGKGGNWIRVNHEGGWQTRYLHLYDVMVKVGDVVKQGQQIGTMGNSGSSTGKHLHYEIRSSGTAHNPLPLINPKPGGR